MEIESTPRSTFPDRLCTAILKRGNHACVGLDPDLLSYPREIVEGAMAGSEFSLSTAAAAIREIDAQILDAVGDLVPAVKFQSSFYEALGPDGVAALRAGILDAKERGLIVIVDAKRNDVAHSAEAYARAYVGETRLPDGSLHRPFAADAVTVSPFLGTDGVEPFVNACNQTDNGIFLLLRTSNPSGRQVQAFGPPGRTVAHEIGSWVNRWNEKVSKPSRFGYGPVGVVVGATARGADIRRRVPTAFALVPGYGAQGGTVHDVKMLVDSHGLGALVSSSRGILYDHDHASSYLSVVRARTEAMCEAFPTC